MAVLLTSLIVVATVAAALTISTAGVRSDVDRSDHALAVRIAESEIHRLASRMRHDASWRSEHVSGDFSNWADVRFVEQVGTNASARHRLVDADGDLADDLYDPAWLTVHTRVGRSEAAVEVELESDPKPLELLRYCVTAVRDLRLNSGATVACEGNVQVADDCSTDSSGILSTPVLHCGDFVALTLRGEREDAAVVIPSLDVVQQYVNQGTQISTIGLPLVGSDWVIEDRLISAAVNPFGSTDPAGIYWIDAGGNGVILSHCRLHATLAIRNASQILVRGGIVWTYPTTPDAILVSDSPVLLQNVDAELDEAARGVNFNPTVSPYREVLANGLASDTYPSELRGLMYTTADWRFDGLTSDDRFLIVGSVVARDVTFRGHTTVRPLTQWMSQPPRPLTDPTPMKFVRGSFRKVASP